MKEVVFYGDDPRAEQYVGKYGSKKIKITQQLQPSTLRLRKKEKKSFLKKLGINPHIHTTKQLNKMTKKGLIRLVIKLEKFIVYQIYKSKLPRLSLAEKKVVSRFKGYKKSRSGKLILRKPKRKFSRKQLAAQRLFAKRARAGTLRRR